MQDFTQAAIRLFMAVVRDPNQLVFCGDTAQTISRGVGFRFADIRSMFFADAADKLSRSPHQDQDVDLRVPALSTMTHNYRTTNAILGCANSIVEMLVKYFSSTIDRLPSEVGFFDG